MEGKLSAAGDTSVICSDYYLIRNKLMIEQDSEEYLLGLGVPTRH